MMPPDVLPVRANALPSAMIERAQWVAWRFARRGEKWTKIPIDPRSGRLASATDAATWGTFGEAVAYADTHRLPGIGYVFASVDPFAGVDLDGCRDPESGTLEPRSAAIVSDLDSYTELSPSRRGVHVIVRASLPQGTGARRRVGSIEMYDRDRYFTMTGHRVPGTSHGITDRQDALDALYTRVFPYVPAVATSSLAAAPPTATGLSDAEVVRRAMAARNGALFAALFVVGDTTPYENNHSRADEALCSLLAFWTRDPAQIDRLFRRSGLYRVKWDREDYRDRTIRRALDLVTDHFGGGSTPHPARVGPARVRSVEIVGGKAVQR